MCLFVATGYCAQININFKVRYICCRSNVSSLGSISMASSYDNDLDEEDIDNTSYERATETSDTDDNDDSDGRGSKSDKVRFIFTCFYCNW